MIIALMAHKSVLCEWGHWYDGDFPAERNVHRQLLLHLSFHWAILVSWLNAVSVTPLEFQSHWCQNTAILLQLFHTTTSGVHRIRSREAKMKSVEHSCKNYIRMPSCAIPCEKYMLFFAAFAHTMCRVQSMRRTQNDGVGNEQHDEDIVFRIYRAPQLVCGSYCAWVPTLLMVTSARVVDHYTTHALFLLFVPSALLAFVCRLLIKYFNFSVRQTDFSWWTVSRENGTCVAVSQYWIVNKPNNIE